MRTARGAQRSVARLAQADDAGGPGRPAPAYQVRAALPPHTLTPCTTSTLHTLPTPLSWDPCVSGPAPHSRHTPLLSLLTHSTPSAPTPPLTLNNINRNEVLHILYSLCTSLYPPYSILHTLPQHQPREPCTIFPSTLNPPYFPHPPTTIHQRPLSRPSPSSTPSTASTHATASHASPLRERRAPKPRHTPHATRPATHCARARRTLCALSPHNTTPRSPEAALPPPPPPHARVLKRCDRSHAKSRCTGVRGRMRR